MIQSAGEVTEHTHFGIEAGTGEGLPQHNTGIHEAGAVGDAVFLLVLLLALGKGFEIILQNDGCIFFLRCLFLFKLIGKAVELVCIQASCLVAVGGVIGDGQLLEEQANSLLLIL